MILDIENHNYIDYFFKKIIYKQHMILIYIIIIHMEHVCHYIRMTNA